MNRYEPDGFSHLIADFVGVAPAKLRDASLIGGLLVAAAGAAGLSAVGAPVVRRLAHDGVAGILFLDECHMTVHTFPDRELMMLDILSRASLESSKALDVFARRLDAREIRREIRARGT